MRIRRLSLAAGAREARGLAVIIDVFRAFSCEPLMLYCGARRVFLEADVAEALRWRGSAVLVGEVNEQPIDGFDLVNSPALILQAGAALFAGRDVVHRTTSGVTGAVAALRGADEVLLASFINSRATADLIRARQPAEVSIVAMGIRSQSPAPEDEACADYLQHLLDGSTYDHVAAIGHILAHETAQKFLRGDKPYLPREDPAICLQRDLFDFALRAERHEGRVIAQPVRPG